MIAQKRIRLIKKIRESSGRWRFVSLDRIGTRYVWDQRPGTYFVEWWEGKKRRRERAGVTPSEATEAQRRKRNELVGEQVSRGRELPQEPDGTATPLADAITMFLDHVRVHSPDKPRTLSRYGIALAHLERILASKKYVEAITRADIDDFKTQRSKEYSDQHPNRKITPRTINFELSVIRTFFYFLINERGLKIENPCARFKALKDPRAKAKRRPPTYTQSELNRLFAEASDIEKATFATLLLTGLREEELCFLTWRDLEIKRPKHASIKVTPKDGFTPKDYEERIIPIPEDLVGLLKKLPRTANWVFPTKTGRRETHLLRHLKELAQTAEVQDATLHKFRHTYATRLLESGCDIVTVQKLMGHSDIETTRQYLNPDEDLKRQAVNRLKLTG